MEYRVTDTELTSVANAIRTKGGTSELLEWPDEFEQAIIDLPTATLGTKTITENGVYKAADDGFGGYSKVTVSVVYGLKAPHSFGTGTFYQAALNGQEQVTLPYYDPDTGQLYDVTIPNDNDVLQWDNTAVIAE